MQPRTPINFLQDAVAKLSDAYADVYNRIVAPNKPGPRIDQVLSQLFATIINVAQFSKVQIDECQKALDCQALEIESLKKANAELKHELWMVKRSEIHLRSDGPVDEGYSQGSVDQLQEIVYGRF